MNGMYRIQLTREQMEHRRLLALEDIQIGIKQSEVARKYGVSRAAVSQWTKKAREDGLEALRGTISMGRPKKLDNTERSKLVEILVAGACASGFDTDLWTGKRVAMTIQKRFGVEYHFKHIPKLLRSLDFRLRKPKKRAAEQNESDRQYWLETTWVQIKKT